MSASSPSGCTYPSSASSSHSQPTGAGASTGTGTGTGPRLTCRLDHRYALVPLLNPYLYHGAGRRHVKAGDKGDSLAATSAASAEATMLTHRLAKAEMRKAGGHLALFQLGSPPPPRLASIAAQAESHLLTLHEAERVAAAADGSSHGRQIGIFAAFYSVPLIKMTLRLTVATRLDSASTAPLLPHNNRIAFFSTRTWPRTPDSLPSCGQVHLVLLVNYALVLVELKTKHEVHATGVPGHLSTAELCFGVLVGGYFVDGLHQSMMHRKFQVLPRRWSAPTAPACEIASRYCLRRRTS